jgi:endonuclease I
MSDKIDPEAAKDMLELIDTLGDPNRTRSFIRRKRRQFYINAHQKGIISSYQVVELMRFWDECYPPKEFE